MHNNITLQTESNKSGVLMAYPLERENNNLSETSICIDC